MKSNQWNVVDLFSGAGGMSCGFHEHEKFRIIGAVDAQNGKPSSGKGTLECNKTYAKNIGIQVLEADISQLTESTLRAYLQSTSGTDKVDVLISCAPCTGFSRTVRKSLIEDDARNSLVVKSGDFVDMFRPSLFVMENVGELLQGKFSTHFGALRTRLENMGYGVRSEIHYLNRFGLPQARRRALVVAAKKPIVAKTLDDLWSGYAVTASATTVRRAIATLPVVIAGEAHIDDPLHVSPNFSDRGLQRLSLIPKDGGSWPDLLKVAGGKELLIPSMLRQLDLGRFGPYTDIYGRLAWDKPAVTLKRECGNTGNGRYCHPEQDRHCTVREMATLQGFPKSHQFVATSVSNMYRHIGDSVPPLISYQLAHACAWALSGKRPNIKDCILPGTHLTAKDITEIKAYEERIDINDFEKTQMD
jgi:DNA (cytosine-5)-methyltransferase 1